MHLRKCWLKFYPPPGMIWARVLRDFCKQALLSPCDAQNTSFRRPHWVTKSHAEVAGGSGINVVQSKARTFQYFYQAEVYLHVFVKDNPWQPKRIQEGGWPLMDVVWAEPKNRRGLGIVERPSESQEGGGDFFLPHSPRLLSLRDPKRCH